MESQSCKQSVRQTNQTVGKQSVGKQAGNKQRNNKTQTMDGRVRMTWLSEWMCGCMVDSLCALCINTCNLVVGSVFMHIGYVWVQFWTAQYRTTDWWQSFWHTSKTIVKSLEEKFLLRSNTNNLIFASFRIGCMRWNRFNTYIHAHIHNLGAAKDAWKYTGVKTTIMSLKKIFSTTSDVSNTTYMQFEVSRMRYNCF